jgi:hypothetical protein
LLNEIVPNPGYARLIGFCHTGRCDPLSAE